jgi:hypothetical protein
VTSTSLAEPRHPNTRELRALALAGEHFEEIALSHRGGTYTVPASSEARGSYDVTYTAREESCSCPDWQIRGAVCYHIMACAVVRAKSGVCAGCGARFRHRELVEVQEDHESLTWFVGDRLCEACASATGIL